MNMRKCFLLLLALFLLTGCTPAVTPPEDETSSNNISTAAPDAVSLAENTTADVTETEMSAVIQVPDTPLSIRYQNRQTFPYVNFLWAESWTEYGWLNGDGMSVSMKFAEIQAEIPAVTYRKDWEILYQDGVSFLYASVYSETFERLYHNAELSVLDELTDGNYYLVITVKKQGDYIEADQKYESTGYECAFFLEVAGD